MLTMIARRRAPGLFALVVALAASPAAAQPSRPPPPVAPDDAPPAQGAISVEAPSSYEARVNEPIRIAIRAVSPGSQPLTFSVVGAPPGATLVPQGTYAELRWRPRDEDIGAYPIVINVTDGARTGTHELSLVVVEEWKSFFMPGLQYSGYGPAHGSGQLPSGSFHGVSGEFLLYAWIARNDNRGPSHGRLYIDLDVLFPTAAGVGSAFVPTMGIDLSVERNPQRRVLLPYFGFETGAIFQKQIDRLAIVVPFLGVHLFSSPNVFANLTAGYLLPIDAERFDDLRGWRVKLGIDFSLW